MSIFVSTDVLWVRTNGAGEEVNGEMLGLKSWMVRTQKTVGFEAGEKEVRK